ncbi:MAG: DUF4830 domain-containing protein [Ruminococcus sp.]|nr:DUF4830 domain-containing protein [Ruminococcus sp.]
MFIKTVKLKKAPTIAICVLLFAIIALLVVFCIIKASADKTYKVETEQQRQALIKELGWETSEKPTDHKTTTIPTEFDEVYASYNELQIQQGFDLENFKGKEVEIYYYPVYNYNGHEDCMQLTLIGCEGIRIGGDLCCTELDGFMTGILRTEDADAKDDTSSSESEDTEETDTESDDVQSSEEAPDSDED